MINAEHPAPGQHADPPSAPATHTDEFIRRLRDQIGSGEARFGTVDLHELRVVLDELERLRCSDVEPDWDEDGITGWMSLLDVELDTTSTRPEIRIMHTTSRREITIEQATHLRNVLDTVIRRAAQ